MKRERSEACVEHSAEFESKKRKVSLTSPSSSHVCSSVASIGNVRAVCGQCESVMMTTLSNPTHCLTELFGSECDPSPSILTNQKALIYAIGQGHVLCVIELLKYCTQVNSTQYAGISPLHMCAGAGHVAVMQELIKHGADVNLQLKTDNLTPLQICAAFGSVECLKLLLENKADPLQQTSNSSMNAVHFAAYHGRSECIKVFLDHGCDINLPSEISGRTPLHYAAVRGQVETFEYLLKNNADISILDSNGHSALVYAANGQQGLDIVQYFSVSERRKWLSVALVNVNLTPIEISSERNHAIDEFSCYYPQLQEQIDQTNSFDRVPMFHFSFKNELGEGLGVVREWFSQLPSEIHQLGLFTNSSKNNNGLYFAKQTQSNEQQLLNAEIVGALLGLGLIHGHLVPIKLALPLYKLLLGEDLDPDDIAFVDREFFNQIKALSNCSEDELQDLQLDFTQTEISEDGQLIDIELIENGLNQRVTKQNLSEYIRLSCLHRLVYQRSECIQRFVSSFHRLIPVHILKSTFNVDELKSIMIGEPRIPLDAWKSFTTYENCTVDSPQIIWFWRALQRFSSKEKQILLSFCTGYQALPIGGFQQLAQDRMPFTIQLHRSSSCLPSSRTCFNTLVLPAYDSYQSLLKGLKLVLSVQINEIGFGFV